MAKGKGSFGLQGFIARWLMTMFLVLATYNPSGYSFWHWVADLESGDELAKLAVAILLGIIYVTIARASLRSLGVGGVVTWFLVFATVTALLEQLGLIRIAGPATLVTITLVLVANVLAVGLSWSFVRSRLTGQSETNSLAQ
jgi:hypothetical protein